MYLRTPEKKEAVEFGDLAMEAMERLTTESEGLLAQSLKGHLQLSEEQKRCHVTKSGKAPSYDSRKTGTSSSQP